MYAFRTKISRKSCFYCQAPLYQLGDGRVKCSYCQKKYTPKRIEKQIILIEMFCKDFSALMVSKRLKINYLTVKRAFDDFRKKIALFLEEEYEKNRDNVLEYDEYIYLEASKRNDKRFIFDGFDFLTFNYGNKVYNILMPPLDRYKSSFLKDGLEEIYYKEFSKFLKLHRVAKINAHQNTITNFWSFLDSFFRKYKGVKRENFFFYLKEAEFKFNYPNFQERVEILKNLILRN